MRALTTAKRTWRAPTQKKPTKFYCPSSTTLTPQIVTEFTRQIHESLRTLARVQRYVADPKTLESLRLARSFAPDAKRLRDTLFEEQAFLHDQRSEEWLAVLELLETECGDLDIPCDYVPAGKDQGEIEYAFVPRITNRLKNRDSAIEIPTGLWVRIERSAAHIRAGRFEQAFEDLHEVVHRYSDVQLLESTAYEYADVQIARALELGGGEGHTRFEKEAQELLETALEADSAEALKIISLYYPRSQASLKAHDSILESSIKAGDAAAVARILQSEFAENWTPHKATARDAQLLGDLAALMRTTGNRAFFRGVLRQLARVLPDLRLEGEAFAKKTLAERAEEFEQLPARIKPAELATFDARCRSKLSIDGDWKFHGYAPGATDELDRLQQVAIFSSQKAIMAISSNDNSGPLWTYEFIQTRRQHLISRNIAFTDGRVLVYVDNWLIGLNREDGTLEWNWDSRNGEVESIRTEGGVALALQNPKGREAVLQALDAHNGIELWELQVNNAHLQAHMPLTSEGLMVFLPSPSRVGVEVRELYTSRKLSQFELPLPPDRNAYEQAWVEDNLLIEPNFLKANRPELNYITAYDLETGQVAWQESFDEKGRRELISIVQYHEDSYLVLRPRVRSEHEKLSGQIMRLHVGFGALQPVGDLTIGKHHTPVGISIRTRSVLEAPYVFLRSASRDDTKTQLRAIHLPHGERWVHSIPIPEPDLYSRMPGPTLSDSTVVLAFNEWPRNAAQPDVTRLRFIDRATGTVKDARDLVPENFPRADELDLVPLGSALILVGPDKMEILE